MTLKKFKEEFRGKVTDFAVSGYLLRIGTKNDSKKKKMVEEMYQNLESWVIQQFVPSLTYKPPAPTIIEDQVESEDTADQMDF